MPQVVVTVPLSHAQTMTLLLQAAESLQHQVVRFDAERGRFETRADFSLGTLSTFRIHAEATEQAPDRTLLRLRIATGFRLTPWTGYGESERVGWQLIGKMQQLLDPERYRREEDADVPAVERAETRPLEPEREQPDRHG
jgi:hypothetical protein